MSNTTIYPFGLSSSTPSGIWNQKIASFQDTIDSLAPWAFRGTPSEVNPAFRKATIFPQQNTNTGIVRLGVSSSVTDYLLSPIFEMGNNGDTVNITFSIGETVSSGYYPGVVYFNKDYNIHGYNLGNANPRTVSITVSDDVKYCRLLIKTTNLLNSYLKINSDMVFDGSNMNTGIIKYDDDFRNSQYWLDWGPNSRGDWIGWNFNFSDTAATSQRNDANYPISKPIGTASTPVSYSISKMVALPESATISVEFSCGVVNSSLMIRALNPSTGSADYFSANANPRTVNINSSTYPYVQLYFLTANYADCYMKDATNNIMLWEGAASTD